MAFSREQPHKVRPRAGPHAAVLGPCWDRAGTVALTVRPHPQVYVQHLLRRDKEHLWQLIHEAGAHIYVCG